MHNKTDKFLCPIAEFFSSGHDAKTISSYLLLVKDELEKYIPKKCFQHSPIIVTDFSWGLINAVIRTFNNCSFETYINWCADLIIKKQVWKIHNMQTINHLCYAHFMKLMAKKIKKVKKFTKNKNNRKLHQVALYSLAILQQSETIEEFNQNMKNCYNIFNTKYESNMKSKSLKEVKEKVMKGNFYNNFHWREINENQNEKKEYLKYPISKNSSLKESSIFLNYFKKIINLNKKNIYIKSKNSGKSNYKRFNNYYCPKIYDALFQYIHLMPLWSNVLINIWNSYFNMNIERLSNNPVENWFHQIKQSLKLFLPTMPSVYANCVFNVIESIYEEYPVLKNTKLKNYRDLNKESTENWSKKRSSFRKEKNFYDKLQTIDDDDVFNNFFQSIKKLYK